MKKFFVLSSVAFLMLACNQKDSTETSTHRKGANETEVNIYRAADSMMATFKRQDWRAYSKYNHPAMTQMMGGEDNFVSFIQEQMRHIPDTAIKSIGVGNILQVVKTDKDQQCVVEQNMHLQLDSIDIKTTSYLVGESLDAGKTWTFFDASSSGLVTPKTIKPNLSAELKIPEQKKEVKQLQ